MASTRRFTAFQETTKRMHEQEQLRRLDQVSPTLNNRKIFHPSRSASLVSCPYILVLLHPAIIKWRTLRSQPHWHEDLCRLTDHLQSRAIPTHMRAPLFHEAQFTHSIQLQSCQQASRLTMGSYVSRQTQRNEHDRTWRGRGTQAVRDQITGEPVMADA